ncbi:MAG: hypothetical protein K6G58_03915 [Lachnospiraceae bacterium]|nr:hypothetical protein [Lachnospiraceae bacterium]
MRTVYYGEYDHLDRVRQERVRRMERTRQVRKQKLLMIIGVMILMALSIFSVKAFANTDTTAADSFGTKQYKSIMIYCGDTVDSIAESNYSFQFRSVGRMASEIRSINHLSADEKLIPGNYLVIPYFDKASGY